MKQLLLIIGLLLSSQWNTFHAATANGLSNRSVGRIGKVAPAGSNPTYLVYQNFEGPGYDNGETWTETGTGIDEDYTGLVLVGSQSCRVLGAAGQYHYVVHNHTNFASTQNSYMYWQVQFQNIKEQLMTGWFSDSVASTRIGVTMTAGGAMTITSGSGTATTVGTMSTGTKYHVWLRYKPSDGSNNGQGEIAFSTDGVRPTSGNNFASFANGTISSTADAIAFIGSNGGNDLEYVMDRVIVHNAQIGDNP